MDIQRLRSSSRRDRPLIDVPTVRYLLFHISENMQDAFRKNAGSLPLCIVSTAFRGIDAVEGSPSSFC